MSDLSAFDFDLPEENIALRPADPQDAARLLVVHSDGRLEDAQVIDLPRYLSAGDVMVFNDTRVIPAALKGVRAARDAQGSDVSVDVNLVERLSVTDWLALARPGKRLRVGDTIGISDGLSAAIKDKRADGELVLSFNLAGETLDKAIDQHAFE
ncbi:MAG: S-adenosylmethionine:tRNA ribosyltransferase-isomerase, partial [Pseudomonadota bacterium]